MGSTALDWFYAPFARFDQKDTGGQLGRFLREAESQPLLDIVSVGEGGGGASLTQNGERIFETLLLVGV